MALFITAFAGIFFLIGAICAYFIKNKNKLIDFSIGMAFSVMIILLGFDIIPEVNELFNTNNYIYVYIFIILGIVGLKVIDIFVPHHDHEAEKNHHERHLKHIGLISSLALIIHNIIEGMAIYNLAILDYKTGFIMALGVGLHNIPFGIEITAMLNETKNNTKEVILYVLLLTISTMVGAVLMLIFGTISDFALGCLMCLTIGMIIYLILFELLIELKESQHKKISFCGIITGILFMTIILVIGG